MSILIEESTPIIVQGMTGRIGKFHAQEMIDYGTNIVAGVTPGKGGETLLDKPIFDTVKQAVNATGARSCIVFVPAPFAADAVMEAANAGIKVCVAIAEGIPAQDMMMVKRYLYQMPEGERMCLIGPNYAGVISPGKSLMGIMPGHIFIPGTVGIIARSGTLGYEAASQMKARGIGVSTSVGIGGDPINGSSFVSILELFESDEDTKAVLMIGEIGGHQEAEAADFIRENVNKPVAAYVAGRTAPPGRVMGHAGAVIASVGESAEEKINTLKSAGVIIAPSPSDMGTTMEQVLADNP